MKKLKKNENSKSWNTYYELAGTCILLYRSFEPNNRFDFWLLL